MSDPSRIGIVTVSDRASRGEYEDRGGPAVREFLERAVTSPWEPREIIVPDDEDALAEALRRLCDNDGCALIVTTGGTGPAPRDVTPDVTVQLCETLLPGFGERMRAVSMEKVPTSMLSRQVAGIRGATLIINVPGSPKAIAECLSAVFPAVPHCLEQISDVQMETDPSVIESFRPGH